MSWVDKTISHLPEGTTALQARIHRERVVKQPQELTLPELHLIVGRDLVSSGATITVWEPTGGVHPSYRTIYAARWLAPVLTTEGALTIARDCTAAALAELFASGYFEQ